MMLMQRMMHGGFPMQFNPMQFNPSPNHEYQLPEIALNQGEASPDSMRVNTTPLSQATTLFDEAEHYVPSPSIFGNEQNGQDILWHDQA